MMRDRHEVDTRILHRTKESGAAPSRRAWGCLFALPA